MIKKLVLNNFLSHKNTSLEFNPGITVFVGHNGSGKSSIIDSITFAFFNEHTRKSNKNLVTKGINQKYQMNRAPLLSWTFLLDLIIIKFIGKSITAGHLVSVKLDQLKQNILMDKNEKNKPITDR